MWSASIWTAFTFHWNISDQITCRLETIDLFRRLEYDDVLVLKIDRHMWLLDTLLYYSTFSLLWCLSICFSFMFSNAHEWERKTNSFTIILRIILVRSSHHRYEDRLWKHVRGNLKWNSYAVYLSSKRTNGCGAIQLKIPRQWRNLVWCKQPHHLFWWFSTCIYNIMYFIFDFKQSSAYPLYSSGPQLALLYLD